MTPRPWRPDLSGAVLTGERASDLAPTRRSRQCRPLPGESAGAGPARRRNRPGGGRWRNSAATLGLPVVPDRSPHLGPLSGIASVLVWAKRGSVLVLPCDLPLATGDLLAPLMAWHETARPGVAGVATVDGEAQPIVTLWPAAVGAHLARLVSSGTRRLFGVLDEIEWEPVPVDARLLADADTQDDLDRLLGAAAKNQ
ncbi:MAG: NTP transferase domain-containing protein [Acidimicrobiales bacterium]